MENQQGRADAGLAILLGDLLFMGGNVGVLSCLNAKTGEIIRQKRTSAKFTASPVYADGKIYFFSEDGEAPVIAADRELTPLAENRFEPALWAPRRSWAARSLCGAKRICTASKSRDICRLAFVARQS